MRTKRLTIGQHAVYRGLADLSSRTLTREGCHYILATQHSRGNKAVIDLASFCGEFRSESRRSTVGRPTVYARARPCEVEELPVALARERRPSGGKGRPSDPRTDYAGCAGPTVGSLAGSVPNLTNIPALDVVIGLAFIYFILSLVLSSVTETISAVFQVRWKKLQQGLRELFLEAGDQADRKKNEDLWGDFWRNPRIQALFKQTGKLGARGPSYIPPRVLALTLLDTLAPPSQAATEAGGDAPTDEDVAAAATAATQAQAAAAAAATAAASNPGDAHAAAAAKTAAAAAVAKVAASEAVAAAKAAADAQAAAAAAASTAAANPDDPQAVAAKTTAEANAAAKAAVAQAKQMMSDHDLVARAERAAGSVKNPLLQKWLLDALTDIAVDREKILASLESSFDEVTNRVSGWYKRYSAIVVAVLALIVAGALNVDSYAVGSRLWKDDAVRSAIASQAANLTATTCKQPESNGTTGPKGNTGTAGTGGISSSTQQKPSLEEATECVTRLHALALPIGWGKENRPAGWGWASKAFGIFVTAFALMLGAPFWFDTLSKLARLRSTGNPEGTSKKDGTSTA